LRQKSVFDSWGRIIGTVENLYVEEVNRDMRFVDVVTSGLLGLGKKHHLVRVEAVSEEGPGWITRPQQTGVEEALDQQEALTEFADANQLVVKTAVLEKVTDGWPAEELRRAQAAPAETIWLSEAGLSLSRLTPLGAT
jgi:hypothetical protein